MVIGDISGNGCIFICIQVPSFNIVYIFLAKLYHSLIFVDVFLLLLSTLQPNFFSTSTSKSFIEKIHRHIFNNHETETHEGLFASLFHGLSLHCKYSNLC